MSEVIVRMEMPKSCDVCPCLDDYGDYPRCRISNEQRGYNFPIREKRMPNCPIIGELKKQHGEWIHCEGDDPWDWTCSACMKKSEIHGEQPNFCPNCGVKMSDG